MKNDGEIRREKCRFDTHPRNVECWHHLPVEETMLNLFCLLKGTGNMTCSSKVVPARGTRLTCVLRLPVWFESFLSGQVLIVVVYSLICVRLFCIPMHCSPPGFSVQGISQARIPQWVAISFSRRSSRPGIGPTCWLVESVPLGHQGGPRSRLGLGKPRSSGLVRRARWGFWGERLKEFLGVCPLILYFEKLVGLVGSFWTQQKSYSQLLSSYPRVSWNSQVMLMK